MLRAIAHGEQVAALLAQAVADAATRSAPTDPVVETPVAQSRPRRDRTSR